MEFVLICNNIERARCASRTEMEMCAAIADRINEVTQRRSRLVLGWVTIPVCNQPPRSTQPGHPSVGKCSEYPRKLGRKQAH